MVHKFSASQSDFDASFRAFLSLRSETEGDVSAAVSDIIHAVRTEGDAALIRYSEQFDRVTLTPNALRINDARITAAKNQCPKAVQEALALAATRIRTYHEKQCPEDYHYTDETGTTLGWKWTPIEAVGLYVPGGLASYPSSVLMNAIPAKVAGCTRLVMVVPTPGGEMNPAVLCAAALAGIDEIYVIGGAQAIAALAYGTETISPVDKIVGPGNRYVAEAKRQVFGQVGIDTIAGPSEILVVADKNNAPEWIAADLLSQAEHDSVAQSILITDDATFAEAVEEAVEAMLPTLRRHNIARASWETYGGIITVETPEAALPLINRIAPEHLELAVADPEPLAARVQHAGAIFLGRHTPEAIGDYIAGPSHVLPTNRAARFSSGLGVLDFMKRSSLIGCTPSSLSTLAPPAEALAACEGLEAHERSLGIRGN